MFPLYTSTVRGDDKAGRPADVGAGAAAAVAAVAHGPARRQAERHETCAGDAGARDAPRSARWNCSASADDGDNRWRLEFNVRDIVKDRPDAREPTARTPALHDVWPEAQVPSGRGLIRRRTKPAPRYRRK